MTMAPPPQQKCSHADFEFETPAGCPTWELVIPDPAHTSRTCWRSGSTSQPVRKIGKVAKTHIHAEHDGVPVELHEVHVGQLHQADRGARGYESDAATGCL